MNYIVEIAFNMANRDYNKGTTQNFEEWLPEEQAERIPLLLAQGKITGSQTPVSVVVTAETEEIRAE